MKRNLLKITIPALACAMVFTGGFTAYAAVEADLAAANPIVSELPAAKLSFTSYSGKVSAVKVDEKNENLGSITLSDETGEILILNLAKACPVLDVENKTYLGFADIKVGDNATIILGADGAMTASLPPITNEAAMIIKTDDEMDVKIDVFGEEFLSSDKQLQLNLSDETFIRDANGSKMILKPADIIGKQCVVVYTVITMSLPPQTPPDAVIILDDADAKAQEDNTAVQSESRLVPLRTTFEELGYKVKWTSNNSPIKLVKGDVTIEVTIGSKEFKVNGEAHTADKAAALTGSVTFVDSTIADLAK